MRQRASSYHFSPTPLGASGDFVEFPKDADPILRVIYQLRGVEGSSPPDLEQAPSTISSSAASNSDSGIGGRDTDAQPQQQVCCLDSMNGMKLFSIFEKLKRYPYNVNDPHPAALAFYTDASYTFLSPPSHK